MHSKIFITGCLAAIATAGSTGVAVFVPDETTMAFYSEHDRRLNLPPPVWPIIPVSSAGHIEAQQGLDIVNNDHNDVHGAIQRPIAAQMPQMTPIEHHLDQEVSLKYLPKPGSMPTTTPHYATDMAAHLHSAIASNMAKVKGQLHSSIDSMELILKISSLRKAEESAGASLTSLSRAMETELYNFKSASKSLASKEHEYKQKKNHDKKKGTATVLCPPWSLVVSFAAAVGFAGLAFVL